MRQAEEIASLLAQVESVVGVLLFGSVARGSQTACSDMDLLVVGTDPELRPSSLQRLAHATQLPRLSLSYYLPEGFRRVIESRTTFARHLLLEGVVLYDRHGSLTDLLRSARQAQLGVSGIGTEVPDEPLARSPSRISDVGTQISDEIGSRLRVLRPYQANPEAFRGSYLFVLARAYSVAKSLAIIGLANAGVDEYDRDKAFTHFVRIHPEAEEPIRRLSELKIYKSMVTGRHDAPSEEPSDHVAKQALADVAALAELAGK
jgi:predicted nucleotidyltransferase